MNLNFKQLSLAAAVSAGTLGLATAASAATVADNALGQMAIIPYYTVNNGFVTGVHVTNTSKTTTEVVKLRLRRGRDSADALDFNLILSPEDVWTGYVSEDEKGIFMASTDNSCTAPARVDGRWDMPAVNAVGSEEGYIEIIGMGSADPNQPISAAAKHVAGTPVDCAAVRSNFFQNLTADPTKRGVLNFDLTHQIKLTNNVPSLVPNDYVATGNVLKVSYFYRDTDAGLEFGDNAVHVKDFLTDAAMSNQQQGLANGDITGFDYPDLNGGSYLNDRGLFVDLRSILGVSSLLNDWSYNADNGVSVDWVVTFPGQYTMVDLARLVAKPTDPNWDYRDLPVVATFDVIDREEGRVSPEEGGLVISPSRDPAPDVTLLANEVNVIEWGPTGHPSVFGSSYVTRVAPAQAQEYGWATLSVQSAKTGTATHPKGLAVCDPTGGGAAVALPWDCSTTVVANEVPMVGFAAWQRTFADPDKNYGRIVAHSWTQ